MSGRLESPQGETVSRSAAKLLAVFMLLGAGAAGTPVAADGARLTHSCAAVDDPAGRLACYDAAFKRPDPAEEAREVIEEFGLTEAQLQARDPERPSRDKGPERIEAQVVSIRHRSTGERIITLDNGQVWLQTEVTIRGPLANGDAVVIRRAALGSFQLVTPGQVALRVRRIE
jgi:hypothetical protein